VVNLEPARTDDSSLESGLVTLTRRAQPVYYAGELVDLTSAADVLTMALPHHREVSAAWALPRLAALADEDERGGGQALPMLADCSGPIGPAMSLALAYTLAARHESDRAAAVDAFLALAAGPEPFSEALGADLADLCTGGTVKLTRVVPALTEAHRAGASAAVWEVLAAALPALLPVAPRGLADLVELATQVADAAGVRADVPALAELAARNGTARLTKEARRLHAVLTASPAKGG
jgi:hypothetical protein